MLIKNILVIQGQTQYGVLNIFADEMVKQWEDMGLQVKVANVTNDFVRMDTDDVDLVFSFNGMRNSGLFEGGPEKNKNVLVWSFMVDHPLWHSEALNNVYRNRVVSFVDINHTAYALQHFGNNQYACFMPHGGVSRTKPIPWHEKKYDVSFLGTYEKAEEFLNNVSQYDDDTVEMFTQMIAMLYTDYTTSWEEELRKQLSYKGITLTDLDFNHLLQELWFLDKYVRNQRRHDVIETLLSCGVQVHVFGNGWEKFESDYKQNLIIHGNVEHDEAIEVMAQSRIVLNVMPLFAKGSHERVFTTMGVGSICVTDRSLYLEECFENEKDIFFYSMDNLPALPDMVRRILLRECDVEGVVQKAHQKVVNEHLWKHRAIEIINIAEQITLNEKQYIKVNNPIDYSFNGFIQNVEQLTEQDLYLKMRSNLVENCKGNEKFYAVLEARIQEKKHWGTCSPARQEFGVIDERVRELKQYSGELVWLYDHLMDNKSKHILMKVLEYWETWNANLLNECRDKFHRYPFMDRDIMNLQPEETYLCLGKECESIKKSFMIESMKKYKSILCFSDVEQMVDIAVSDNVDAIVIGDVDNAQVDVIRGLRKHIEKTHPKMAISICCGNHDLWRTAKAIGEIDDSYRFYIRYYGDLIMTEGLVLYAV